MGDERISAVEACSVSLFYMQGDGFRGRGFEGGLEGLVSYGGVHSSHIVAPGKVLAEPAVQLSQVD